MMTKYFICCERCFEKIARSNTKAARLWLDLCALHLKWHGVIKIHSLDFEDLRFLEINDYVYSTDRENHLLIQVKGHNYSDVGDDFFCIKDGEHD